ncbi:MAG TPA: hypothetical protein VGM67_14110 [Gemmatimonadaceae bacterium]
MSELAAILDPLTPLLGEWVTDADTPMGRVRCTRQFAPAVGSAYIELIAHWAFGAGRDYEERALFGAVKPHTLGFWSFTSDGGHAHGEIADVHDIHPTALGFIAAMPAGRARQAYWRDDNGVLHWIVEAETPNGWERFTAHQYRRTAPP